MKHAGPSITITSLTNALAFYFGSTTSLIALRSFCIFACASIVFLYLACLTIFLCVVIWDTQRVKKKKGECCRLCMCNEDSVICCYGFFLSEKQKKYSGLITDNKVEVEGDIELKKIQDADNVAVSGTNEVKEGGQDENKGQSQDIQDPESNKPAQKKPKKKKEGPVVASETEKFLRYTLAPELLSTNGRISVLFMYFVLIVTAIYGATQVTIDLKLEYFIPPTSIVYPYF
jgi:predicted RND superfamily exporter protein